MIPNIVDLGVWRPYTPDPMPTWTSAAAPGQQFIFVRRDGDGVDWYEFRNKPDAFTRGYLVATTLQLPNSGQEIFQGIHRDRCTIAVPVGVRVVEIEDLDLQTPAPWKAYEGRLFDPRTLTVGDLWTPPIAAVRDYQFAGQAAAEGIISDDDAMAWVGGTVPAPLMAAVTRAVPDPERRKRVLLFLAGTTVFPRDHELTPVLAASFGKDTPAKIDAFFAAAAVR